MSPQESRPAETNCETAQSNSAGDLKLALSVSQPRRTARFDSRRTLARRAIVRELDEWFGNFRYPDLDATYPAAPSREAVRDG